MTWTEWVILSGISIGMATGGVGMLLTGVALVWFVWWGTAW